MKFLRQWYRFEELTLHQLYALIKLREEVFVVEQNCVYLDCDGKDQGARHLLAWQADYNDHLPIACIRLLPPEPPHNLPRLGRLLTSKKYRGNGLASTLVADAIIYAANLYPHLALKISAQVYLQKFYEAFGFTAVSAPYDEDGIMHLDMIRVAA